ncbi:hypothetical protein PVNG_03113 [Plasmodium vivax North Korean]|uniref:Uncharacterized protein n=1 Tax=Plasmodium vivax North Korean TaxID=1035514 RepID=A0A0J9TYA7_PLAVI|nr:hypothetical protein PVNG_03113 [Plasmodium vivax North Korean]
MSEIDTDKLLLTYDDYYKFKDKFAKNHEGIDDLDPKKFLDDIKFMIKNKNRKHNLKHQIQKNSNTKFRNMKYLKKKIHHLPQSIKHLRRSLNYLVTRLNYLVTRLNYLVNSLKYLVNILIYLMHFL